MEMLRGLNDVDELERELRAAMRDLDFDTVDHDLLPDPGGECKVGPAPESPGSARQ